MEQLGQNNRYTIFITSSNTWYYMGIQINGRHYFIWAAFAIKTDGTLWAWG
jgi:hypothetical protein